MTPKATSIGTLRESHLHAAIKDHYTSPGDRQEVPLEGFVIDLVRADGELVEVQTGSFWPLKPKLERLLDFHRMRVVHPIPGERQVVRYTASGELKSSRKSPLKGRVLDIFEQLVFFPTLLSHPNFSLDVLMCSEEHLRDEFAIRPRRGRTEGGQRRFMGILERVVLDEPRDAAALLPARADEPFTTRELAAALACGQPLAQRIVYCLTAMEVVRAVGKRGRSPLYVRVA